jgi:hypothetical protein
MLLDLHRLQIKSISRLDQHSSILRQVLEGVALLDLADGGVVLALALGKQRLMTLLLIGN